MANSILAVSANTVSAPVEASPDGSEGAASDFAAVFQSTVVPAVPIEGEASCESLLPDDTEVIPEGDVDEAGIMPDSLMGLFSGLTLIPEPAARISMTTMAGGDSPAAAASVAVTYDSGTMGGTSMEYAGKGASVVFSNVAGMNSVATPVSMGATPAVIPVNPAAAGESLVAESVSAEAEVQDAEGDDGAKRAPATPLDSSKVKTPLQSVGTVPAIPANAELKTAPADRVPLELAAEPPVMASNPVVKADADKPAAPDSARGTELNGFARHEKVLAPGPTTSSHSGGQSEAGGEAEEGLSGELAGHPKMNAVPESTANDIKGAVARQELPFGETVSALLSPAKSATGLTAGEPLHRFEKIQQLLDNVGVHVLEVVKGSGNQMTISLVPGELGRVLLSCQEKGQLVTVTVQAENQAACSLLQRQEDAVRTLLAQGGYELGRFEVGSWNGQRQETPGKEQRGQLFESEDIGFADDLRKSKSGMSGLSKSSSPAGAGRFWAVA